MKRPSLALVAITLLAACTSLYSQGQPPSRDVYKAQADVVKLIQQAAADRANVIQEQCDAGARQDDEICVGNTLVHHSYTWMAVTEHSAEHYG